MSLFLSVGATEGEPKAGCLKGHLLVRRGSRSGDVGVTLGRRRFPTKDVARVPRTSRGVGSCARSG